MRISRELNKLLKIVKCHFCNLNVSKSKMASYNLGLISNSSVNASVGTRKFFGTLLWLVRNMSSSSTNRLAVIFPCSYDSNL